VKFTAKQAATPPQAIDSKRVGLRAVISDMLLDVVVGSSNDGVGGRAVERGFMLYILS
jgi:hypothetical protein